MTPKGWLVVVVVVLFWALSYAGSCAWKPWRDCWCCDGSGKHYLMKDGKQTKKFHVCRWCRGSSKRMRYGRRIYNHFHKVKKRAKA